MSPWEGRMARLFSALRLESIKNKIVALAVAATLIPTVTTAVVSYAQNTRSLADQLEHELQRAVSQTALELDLWLQQQLVELAGLETSYVVSENLAQLQEDGPGRYQALSRLEEYVGAVGPRLPDFSEVLILDSQGVPVASSRAGSSSGPPEAWARSVVGGDEGFGEPFLDPESGALAAYAGRPVRSPSRSQVLGAVVARVRLQDVRRLLGEHLPTHGGRVMLVLGDGRVGGSSEPAGEGAGSDVERRSIPLPAAGQVVEYEGDGGHRVLAASAPVEGRQMSVLVELPRNQAYAPLHQLRNLTFALVALLLLVIGSVAYFLGQAIVRPLARLTSGAAEVAAGDFSVDLPTLGGGEVNDLTEVFNDMVRHLRDGRRALDEAHEELMERNAELERLSITDGLTDLINRRRGMEILHEEVRRSDRYDVPMSLLMVDVDHFKRYNDTHGHLEGDMVLRAVSKAIKQATRGVDTASRFGGEEFMVLLPECDADGALEAARRMRERLAGEEFRGGHVTMSVGAAVYPLHADHPEGLIAAADAALYRAKDAGRDRAVLSEVDRGALPDGLDPLGPAVNESRSEGREVAAEKKPAAGKRPANKKSAAKSTASKSAD